jgi:Tfp pilus assembly protein PilO
MADPKSVLQILVNNLSNLNSQLKSMADSLNNLENNEMEVLKNNYEMKYTVVGEIKNLSKETENVQTMIKDMISKMDVKLEDIKDSLPEQVDSKKCENCMVIKEKDKAMKAEERWIKRLWGAVVVLGMAVLALLGMNLFGIIKLPGIGG